MESDYLSKVKQACHVVEDILKESGKSEMMVVQDEERIKNFNDCFTANQNTGWLKT